MLQAFTTYLHEELGVSGQASLLVAVSGGIDSMVMLSLFEKSTLKFAVAHCNFNLRGEESNNDEQFIKSYCSKKNIKYYSKSFDTFTISKKMKLSTQETARFLRYKWFNETAINHNFDSISVGHNQDDSIETFFINLLRKTGIKGLSGIPERQGKIIRPLLWADRKTITQYATKEHIAYREDSSNKEAYYTRNAIRHKLLPQCEAIRNNAREQIRDTMHALNNTRKLFNELTKKAEEDFLTEESGEIRINLKQLFTKYDNASELLFQCLKNRGCKASVLNDMSLGKTFGTGKTIRSGKLSIRKDRDMLILSEIDPANQEDTESREENQLILYETEKISSPIDLTIFRCEKQDIIIDKSPATAYFDEALIIYPLRIRKWQQGDYFHPFGMNNKKKKVSDYFIDKKISLKDKIGKRLLENGNGDILWIIGERSDHRYRISETTKTVLMIRSS